MKLKSILITLLILCMAFALAACSAQRPLNGKAAEAEAGQGESARKFFPAFAGKTLDGSEVDSKSLFSANKVTVVNFWFSGCAPCTEELDDLNVLNERLRERGGAVIGINTDTLGGDAAQIAEAKKLLTQQGAAYQNIWFEQGSEAGKFAGQILGFPTTYLVDSEGRIIGEAFVGGIEHPDSLRQLEGRIEQALAQP